MPDLRRPFIITPHAFPASAAPRPPRASDPERLHRLFGPKRATAVPPAPWMRRPARTVALELRGARMVEEISDPVVLVVPDLEDYELPCGLRRSEIFTLMLRDLTPEDYDTLLKLDERVAKKTAGNLAAEISAQSAEGLEPGASCGICLVAFSGAGDVVKRLSCGHVFHAECIDRWLKNYADRCPIDNQPLTLS